MLEPALALDAWKNAGSPKLPSVFLDRTTAESVEKWTTLGLVAAGGAPDPEPETEPALGLVQEADATRSLRRESSCNRVLTTQMGLVAVPVTTPAKAAAAK